MDLVYLGTVLLNGRPWCAKKENRATKHHLCCMRSFLLLAVALPLVVAATPSARAPLPVETQPSQEVPNARPLPRHMVFDVPALCALTIGQIRRHLGTPNLSDTEPVPDPSRFEETQWTKSYRREGLELRLDYVRKTEKILRCYLSPAGDAAIPAQKLTRLLATGHLTGRPKGLRITPIFVHQDPTSHRYTTVMVEVR